jgi:hypothetical protein
VFADRLRLALTLVAGSTTLVFPSGSFEHVELTMLPYGFEAEAVVFVSSELEPDPLFDVFIEEGVMKATLSFATCLLDGTDEEAVPVIVTGYVVARSVREEVGEDVVGEPIVGRSYRVRFTDVASAFWRQHRPIELFVGTSFKQVLEQYKTEGTVLTHAWSRLDEEHEVLCVSAGAEGPASFYDFLVWYVDAHGGVIEHDASAGSYRIAGTKTRASAPFPLEKEQIGTLTVLPPRSPRNSARVLNGYSDSPRTIVLPNPQALLGVSHDVLERTPITATGCCRQRTRSRSNSSRRPRAATRLARSWRWARSGATSSTSRARRTGFSS